ncbi:hypothetical protein J1614_009198 [Plenodomus biglobosus]|nr:hypothetical protein J1614_009198 [Plenodomus biglobosus]
MTLTAARYLSERLTGDKGLVATFNPLPDCVFLRPIILDESAEKQSIQLSVSRSANANTSNGVSSSLFARSRKGAKVEYAKCVVVQTDVAAVTAGWSSQAAQNGAGHRLSPPLFYALFSQIVDYSNDYRRISQVSISKNFDEAYAEILVAMNAHGVLGSSSTLQRSRGAPAVPMATVHQHGFTRLAASEQNDEQFCLNVVFVHGLRGHPRGTWETKAGASRGSSEVTKKPKWLRSLFERRGDRSLPADTEQAQARDRSSSPAPPSPSPPSSSPSPVFWPEEYLTQDIPQARVWTYGYNADVIGGLFQANNRNSISQHGRDLSVRLEREIDNGKPLAFVVHSLGGIILKDAIRRSEIVRDRTKLVVFLGTPHRGSAYAGWGQIASNLARLTLQDSNKKMLETLEVNNEVLDNIHEEFKAIMFTRTIKIHSFQEARGITGMKGVSEEVVDDFSSKLDLPRGLETVESIDANHMHMARYSSRDDQGYRVISVVLKACVRQELESLQIPPAIVADVVDVVDAADAASSDTLFMVPFAKDDLFVGREDIIAKISGRRAAAPTHTRVALVGLGGVGKSQVAIEYAYRIQKIEPHMLVVWIHASDPTRFRQGYRKIADKLMLPGLEDTKADVLQLVHAWLSDSRNGPWLMILDNVDDDGVFFGGDQDGAGTSAVQAVDSADHGRPLESFLPQAAHGTILITSRNNMAATNLVGGHGNVVEVEPMGEDEALALLHTRVPFNEASRADAKTLVHALEGIPLAITHAAAYIKTRAPTTNISTYLGLFRESEANQVHLLSRKEWKDIRRDHSIRHAVIATWQISFQHIQKTERPAADLLALMSMYDKQGVPRGLLQQVNTSQLDFDDALAPLLSFSLVRTEIGAQALTMHRLVQLSMRRWLEAESELGRWVKESIQALSAAFPSGDYATWDQCKVLLPHVKEVVRHATEDKEGLEKQAKSAVRAGWYLLLMGEYMTAESFLRRSLEIREKVLGREHPDTLTSANKLGLVLERQGKYNEAEVMQRRALEGYKKVLRQEHPHTLTSVSNLRTVLARQGRYDKVEVIQRRVLEGFKKALRQEHLHTLTSVSNLRLVLERQGRYNKVEVIQQRVLEGFKKALSTREKDIRRHLVLARQGRYDKVEVMHQQALEGYKKALREKDIRRHLVLARQGRYDKAEVMHRRALEGFKKALSAGEAEKVR